MVKLWHLLSVVLCTGAIALTGCGDNGAAPAAAQAKKKIIIGIVAKSVSNPVFQAAHAGAIDAGRELGPKYGVEVEVQIQTPPEESAVKQAEAVNNLVRANASGIAVSCSEANTLKAAIDDAVDKGVPVVCFDSDSPASKRFAFYGTDDEACGTSIMKLLAKEMGDKGTIAILAGSQSAPNLQRRVAAVEAELKNHPNMKEVSIGPVYHEETPAKAAEIVQNIQRANSDIGGWAMVGGWPLFTTDALPWKPGEVKVVAVDALPAELVYLKSGHVQVLLAQDCYGWGYKSVQLLLDKIVKGETPKEAINVDPLAQVTKDNADEWSKNWDRWLKK